MHLYIYRDICIEREREREMHAYMHTCIQTDIHDRCVYMNTCTCIVLASLKPSTRRSSKDSEVDNATYNCRDHHRPGHGNHIYIYIYMCTCVCAYIYIYMYIYMYMYVDIYIYSVYRCCSLISSAQSVGRKPS